MKKFIAIATILMVSVFTASFANADGWFYYGYGFVHPAPVVAAPVVVAPVPVTVAPVVSVVRPVVEVRTVPVRTVEVTEEVVVPADPFVPFDPFVPTWEVWY